MPKKFDGVIEAVQYKDGQIVCVRAYQRRGATFSDRVLLDRGTLFEQLKKGKKFVTGQRKEFWASTFATGKSIEAVGDFISTLPNASRDELEGVPVF